jgi:hypothetical protein
MNNEKPTGEKQTENSKILLNRIKKTISARKVTRSARPVRSLVKMKSIRPMVVGLTQKNESDLSEEN